MAALPPSDRWQTAGGHNNLGKAGGANSRGACEACASRARSSGRRMAYGYVATARRGASGGEREWRHPWPPNKELTCRGQRRHRMTRGYDLKASLARISEVNNLGVRSGDCLHMLGANRKWSSTRARS